MIRLVWINKETKVWGADTWFTTSEKLRKNLWKDKIYMEEINPQYEYYIEER